jgi:hypothetical protein
MCPPARRPILISRNRPVPAHVTVLYPFVPPERTDDAVISSLAAAVRGVTRST